MESLITHKPPNPGDTYNNPDVIQLYDENENPFPIRIGSAQHVPNPTPTTTTTSTSTTTSTQPICALVIGPSGPECAGACGAGTTCLMDPPHSGVCVCAVDSRICTNQTFPACAPPAGLCAEQAGECQTRPGSVCGCCRVPGSQCAMGSQCCSNNCQFSQCQP
jgi:hypothetical protein